MYQYIVIKCYLSLIRFKEMKKLVSFLYQKYIVIFCNKEMLIYLILYNSKHQKDANITITTYLYVLNLNTIWFVYEFFNNINCFTFFNLINMSNDLSFFYFCSHAYFFSWEMTKKNHRVRFPKTQIRPSLLKDTLLFSPTRYNLMNI